MADKTPVVKREEEKQDKPAVKKPTTDAARKPAPATAKPIAPRPSSATVASPRPAPAPVKSAAPAPARPSNPATPTTRPAPRPNAPARPGQGAPRPTQHVPARPGAHAPRPTIAPRPNVPVAQKVGAPVAAPRPPAPPPPPPKPVELGDNLTVRDLAAALKVGPIDIIKKLMANGIMANINQPIDFDTASLVAGELGFEVIEQKPVIVEMEPVVLTSIPKKREYSEAEAANMIARPPGVTVMGHVDHGKTSVLDAIRHADVAGGEAGGITQHIGAYQVVHDGKRITFLDTPGHEAFTAMRARGAKATDLAIIVVAADDGVMPQTREAIDHARAAQVPIIIAMNKIDKADANVERVKQQLSELGLAVYGGKDEVTVVEMSARQKTGIEDLLENISVVMELADLRANPNKLAAGVVIESRLDKQQGAMATLLVQEGTLHIGDAVLIGTVFGKIRAMFSDKGVAVKEAGPADPVAVTGLSDVPEAGEIFSAVDDERIARFHANERALAKRQAEQKSNRAVSLNDLFAQFQAGNIKELNLIVKADVGGSLEPIVSSLEKLSDEKIKVKIIHQGIGNITRSDIMLAVASQGIVIAFNVGTEGAAESLAEAEGIDLRNYNIIYKLIEDIDKALKGMLDPVFEDRLSGRAQVLQVFRLKKAAIAGLRVTQGKLVRSGTAHVMRGGTELYNGPIASLKRFTDDVREVAEGYECGIAFDKFHDFEIGDEIQVYQRVKVS